MSFAKTDQFEIYRNMVNHSHGHCKHGGFCLQCLIPFSLVGNCKETSTGSNTIPARQLWPPPPICNSNMSQLKLRLQSLVTTSTTIQSIACQPVWLKYVNHLIPFDHNQHGDFWLQYLIASWQVDCQTSTGSSAIARCQPGWHRLDWGDEIATAHFTQFHSRLH